MSLASWTPANTRKRAASLLSLLGLASPLACDQVLGIDVFSGDAAVNDAGGPRDATLDHGPSRSPSVVYVRAGATADGDGSMEHPFATLGEALGDAAPPAPLVVHVGPGSYDTSDDIVWGNVTVEGAGPSMDAGTVFFGTSRTDCSAIANSQNFCVLQVLSGSSLSGVLVQAGMSSNGITQTGVDDAATTIRNVVVQGAAVNNIIGDGNLHLGPGVTSTGAQQNGLQAYGGVVTVLSDGGMDNHFDDNGSSGIWVRNDATLVFLGGTISHNTKNGIDFKEPTPGGTVTGASIHANGTNGILAGPSNAPLALIVRNSDLSGNGVGLRFDMQGQGVLHLGADAGGNVRFGAGDGGLPGSLVGLMLCNTPPDASLPLSGVTFQTCPPTELESPCGVPGATYVDVTYSADAPPVACSCVDGGTACQ